MAVLKTAIDGDMYLTSMKMQFSYLKPLFWLVRKIEKGMGMDKQPI